MCHAKGQMTSQSHLDDATWGCYFGFSSDGSWLPPQNHFSLKVTAFLDNMCQDMPPENLNLQVIRCCNESHSERRFCIGDLEADENFQPQPFTEANFRFNASVCNKRGNDRLHYQKRYVPPLPVNQWIQQTGHQASDLQGGLIPGKDLVRRHYCERGPGGNWWNEWMNDESSLFSVPFSVFGF